jgi:GT2 family glycosyltransferase
VLQGSPRRLTPNPNVAAFLNRRAALDQALETRLARHLSHRTSGQLLSIVMPVHETRQDWLASAIESVRAQWSRHWELICVDDGSRAPHVATTLAAFARADQRIRVLRTPANGGIARAVNFGLRAARGDYVAFLDHDDALEPDAVHHLLRAARQTGADLLYSDEIITGPALDQLLELRARPAFSHDYYLSHPYFVHLVAVRTSLAQALTGYDESLPISADVDFVLRAIERARAVAHVPRPLYRWRTHEGSAGHVLHDQVMAATQGALSRHLDRLGHGALVQPGAGFNQFRIDWPDDGGEILIVIPTKDRADLLRTCIDSVERTAKGQAYRIVVIDHDSADHTTRAYLRALSVRHTVMPYRGRFNFSRMNNAAVRQHAGAAPYLLFLNNDVEAIEAGWLERLRSLAGRASVGAVAPLLLYGNGRVQHAGVIVGFAGGADHAMRFREPFDAVAVRSAGANGSLPAVRDYSAVTAACMMMRRSAFEHVGGFDEAFAVGYNDTDLCLRLRAAGLSVLYDGQTMLLHHESATRAGIEALADPQDDHVRLRARWPEYFERGDPYYHPLLTQTGTDHQLRSDDGWKGRLGVRTASVPHAECQRRRK